MGFQSPPGGIPDKLHISFFYLMKTFLFSLLFCTLSLACSFAQSGDPLPAFEGAIYACGTTPVNGTNAVDTLTFGGTPTGGTFTLSFEGKTTGAITWSATNATLVSNIDTALESLATVSNGAGGGVTTAVGTMTAGIGTITITWVGNNAKLAIPALTLVSSLTGTSPTLAAVRTTAGVTADGRKAPTGRLLVDKTHGFLYQNTSTTVLQPNWAKVSSQ